MPGDVFPRAGGFADNEAWRAALFEHVCWEQRRIPGESDRDRRVRMDEVMAQLRSLGMTLERIGLYFGLSRERVRRRLANHNRQVIR